MVGLLDYLPPDQQQAARSEMGYGLLGQLGAALMAAGAPSRDPGAGQRALAQGLLSMGQYPQAYSRGLLGNQVAQMQVAKLQDERKREKAWNAMFGFDPAGVPQAPVQVADASQPGAISMAARMNAPLAGSQDMRGIAPDPNDPRTIAANQGVSTPAATAAADPRFLNDVRSGIPRQILPLLGALGPEKGGAMLAQFALKNAERGQYVPETVNGIPGQRDRFSNKFEPFPAGVLPDQWEQFEGPSGVPMQRNKRTGEQKPLDPTLAKVTLGAPNVNVNTANNPFYSNLGELGAKDLYASRDQASAAANQIQTIGIGKQLIDSGVISGTGANARLFFARALATAGLTEGEDVANTDAFFATMGKQTLDLVKGLGAGVSISNADRDFAERMSGGKIELTEKSMRRMMEINEKVARSAVEKHNAIAADIEQDPNVPGYIKKRLKVTVPEVPTISLPKRDAPDLSGITRDDIQAELRRRGLAK